MIIADVDIAICFALICILTQWYARTNHLHSVSNTNHIHIHHLIQIEISERCSVNGYSKSDIVHSIKEKNLSPRSYLIITTIIRVPTHISNIRIDRQARRVEPSNLHTFSVNNAYVSHCWERRAVISYSTRGTYDIVFGTRPTPRPPKNSLQILLRCGCITV